VVRVRAEVGLVSQGKYLVVVMVAVYPNLMAPVICLPRTAVWEGEPHVAYLNDLVHRSVLFNGTLDDLIGTAESGVDVSNYQIAHK